MPAIDIQRWFNDLLSLLKQSQQRQLVRLCGTRGWCDAQVDALYRIDDGLQLIADRSLGRNPLPSSKADGLLGGNARLVVVDLFNGFDADVMCIAAGLVTAGGILVLLSPQTQNWLLDQDEYARWQDDTCSERAWFVEYIFEALDKDPETGITLVEDSEAADIPKLGKLKPTAIIDGKTVEQAQSTLAIESWLAEGLPGIVLLSAARGRGKSTCLGQLARQLIDQGVRVLVTARSRKAALQILDLAPRADFAAPDRLVESQPEADLLLVDEAAAIPQSRLRQLYGLYPRTIMATTYGGYEGTGQGFRLRFLASLESAELTCLELNDPVRWCPGDALERWVDETLGLNTEAPECPVKNPGNIDFEVIDEPGSPENRETVLQVYRLMSSAHYRTRPSDLRMLMENPKLVLMVARAGERILGAALLNPEGGFESGLCEQVFLGQRRPRGHLLAQMLTAQAGSRRFACLRGLRIQRIAVSTEYRRQGLGSRVLEMAKQYALAGEFDYLGASFALEPDSAEFWESNGFALSHISYARGKSSGQHSVAVLKSLSPQSDDVQLSLQRRLQRQLPIWMTQFLQSMEARQVAALLRFANYRFLGDEIEQADIDAFCNGNKGFELCFASLQTWVMHRIAQSADLPDPLLVGKAVQNRDWHRLERGSGSDGRRQLQQRLRKLVAALDKAC